MLQIDGAASNAERQSPLVTAAQRLVGRIEVLVVEVRIVPVDNRTNDEAPTHRVYVGRAEIGAAWPKVSSEKREYHSLKLDDPSFNAPIFANLFEDEDGESYSLIWSRPRKQNGG